MKNWILILSCLVGFSSGGAGADPVSDAQLSTPSVSRFEVLADWFRQGQPLTYASFKGFYSGRCFYYKQKDTPRNILAGYVEVHHQNAGPGFPDRVESRIGGVIRAGSPAEYFDDETLFATVKEALIHLITDIWSHYSAISESPTLMYTYDWENNHRDDEKFELVKYQDFIVEKHTNLITQRTTNPWEPTDSYLTPRGEVTHMCYFFKKLGE